MILDLTVSQSIIINRPADIVWKGLTEPELIKQYLYGTQTTTNWEVGSPVVFEGEYSGITYHDKGLVKENIPNERLSYLYWSSMSGTEDIPENYSLITYTLFAVDDSSTEFTWTQQGFASQQGYEHSKTGMTDFLASIKQVIENS